MFRAPSPMIAGRILRTPAAGLPAGRCLEAPKGGALDVHDLQRLVQALQRIAPRRRTVLMRDVARESQVRDSLGDKPVIQLLRIVEFVPAGHSARVEMRDPREIV